jgi:hypothetical protein
VLRLGEEDKLAEEVKELEAKLDAMLPGLKQKLVDEKKAKLPPAELAAVNTLPEKRTMAQMELAYGAEGKIEVTPREIADRIAKDDPTKSKQALLLAGDIERETLRLRYTINYKNDSNYNYWYTRAKLEQTPDAIAAREAMFRASRAFREGDPFGAKKLYEEGFASWRKVLDKFPAAVESESATGDDLVQYIIQYRNVLDQLDEEMGEAFPLWDVIERFDSEQKLQDELAAHKQRVSGKPPEAEGAAAEPEAAAPAEAEKPATEAPAEAASQTDSASE